MTKENKSKYLVCVSEKEHSETALRFACITAKKTKNSVEMLYIIDPVDYNTIFSVADVIKEERKTDARNLLRKLSRHMESFSDIKPSGAIREGRIIDVIVKHIEDNEDINLLVMGAAPDGSTAKGGILTNLTAEIGERFHIPMLIVPGNLTDEQIEKLN